MPAILSLALLAAVQAAPPPPPAQDERREVRVIVRDQGPPAMDKDNDGFVSRDEFTGPTNDAFAALDKDRDGRISREEMQAGRAMADVILGGRGGPGGPGMGGPGGPGHDGMGPMRWEMRGPGGPEGPGVGDFVIMHDGPGGPDGPPGGPMRIQTRRVGPDGPDGPGSLDKDGDGRVTEAEFTAPLRDAFQRMDANHDGVLDAAEREGSHQDVRVFVRRQDTQAGE